MFGNSGSADTLHRIVVLQNRKEEDMMLPKEMFFEYIGKNCTVEVLESLGDVTGKLLAVEENWIKVEDKKGTAHMINGSMVKEIVVK